MATWERGRLARMFSGFQDCRIAGETPALPGISPIHSYRCTITNGIAGKTPKDTRRGCVVAPGVGVAALPDGVGLGVGVAEAPARLAPVAAGGPGRPPGLGAVISIEASTIKLSA
jgi:hypothetical protein